MGDEEKAITRELREVQRNSGDLLVTFDLRVTAIYQATGDDKVVETLGALRSDLTPEQLRAVHLDLQGDQDPRRCESVTYVVEKVKIGGVVDESIFIEPREIGEDKHL